MSQGVETPIRVVRTGRASWSEGAAPGRLGERFAWRSKAVSDPLGLRRIEAHLEAIPPGRAACQAHYHARQEERFLVLSGELQVRELDPDAVAAREYTVGAGDLVSYPAGTGVAHQFVNRGSADAEFLAFSRRIDGDICVYPETGKIAIPDLRVRGAFVPSSVDGAAMAGTVLRPRAEAVGEPQLSVRRGRCEAGAVESLNPWSFTEQFVWVLRGSLTVHPVGGDGLCGAKLDVGDCLHWRPGSVDRIDVSSATDGAVEYVMLGEELSYDVRRLGERMFELKLLGVSGRIDEVGWWEGV